MFWFIGPQTKKKEKQPWFAVLPWFYGVNTPRLISRYQHIAKCRAGKKGTHLFLASLQKPFPAHHWKTVPDERRTCEKTLQQEGAQGDWGQEPWREKRGRSEKLTNVRFGDRGVGSNSHSLGQDLIHIIKRSFSLFCGERIRTGASQLRVTEVLQARIRMGAVGTNEVDIFENTLWRQKVGLTGRLDVTAQGREYSEWFLGYFLDQLGGVWCHFLRCEGGEEKWIWGLHWDA